MIINNHKIINDNSSKHYKDIKKKGECIGIPL